MGIFTRKKVNKTERAQVLAPAKWGLVAFVVFCLAALVYDVATDGADRGLSEQAPIRVAQNEVPEPADVAEEPAVAVMAEADAEAEQTDALSSAFAAYRLDREEARAQEMVLLQKVIEDESGSEDARQRAEQRRLDVAAEAENEVRAESLLDAKGFGETVVLSGGGQATVVCSISLDAVKATQIATIVSENCGVSFENVVIVNR